MSTQAVPVPPPTDPFRQHRIDLKAAHDGVWVTIKGDQFLVARMGNERCQRCRVDFLTENGLPPEADITGDLSKRWAPYMVSRAILLDIRWLGAPDVKYDPSYGERIYHDPELQDVRDRILDVSRGDYTGEYLRAQAILGNLLPYSNGSASTDQSETR